MAPFLGPTREQLLASLKSPKLPITLGLYSPQATVVVEEGVWRIRALELDDAAARRAGQEALARGDLWMPEMEWQFLRPGKVLVEAPDLAAFVARVRTMAWPFSR